MNPKSWAALPALSEPEIDVLADLGAAVSAAADRGDVPGMRIANQDFHFAVFDHAPLRLVVSELRRLWTLAMPYHAAYLYEPAVRRRVCAEHDHMIDALRCHDNRRLVELMDEHRRGGESSTGDLLAAQAAQRPPPVTHDDDNDNDNDNGVSR